MKKEFDDGSFREVVRLTLAWRSAIVDLLMEKSKYTGGGKGKKKTKWNIEGTSIPLTLGLAAGSIRWVLGGEVGLDLTGEFEWLIMALDCCIKLCQRKSYTKTIQQENSDWNDTKHWRNFGYDDV